MKVRVLAKSQPFVGYFLSANSVIMIAEGFPSVS
jgi:hypothetical protein